MPMPRPTLTPATWAILAVVVLVLVGGLFWINRGPSTGTGIAGGNTEGLNVSAEGVVYATPDIAKLRFGVSQIGREAAVVEADITTKIEAIKSKVRELGVEDKDIKTVEFGIYPDYGAYPLTENSKIRSYNGRHILEVTIRDLDKADAVADGVIAAGANEVQNIEFTVEDPEKWYQDARTQAISKAKDKAKQLADSADIRLGRLVSINESSNTTPIFYDRAMESSVGMGAGGDGNAGLNQGSLELHAYVTLVYQIR